MAAAAAGGDAAGVVMGSMGVIARLAELFLSRRCNLGWKSIQFSLFAVANTLLRHTTDDSGGAHGLAPPADVSEEKMLRASWRRATVAGPEIRQLSA